MSRQYKSDGERVVFRKGSQKLFLLSVRKALNSSWKELANKVGMHPRTMRDWYNEKYLMPRCVVLSLARSSCVTLPYIVETREKFWYTKKGGDIAGPLTYKRYGQIGSSIKRKAAWYKWWRNQKKSSNQSNLGSFALQRDIREPKKSEALAEFFGILLGDGGISLRQVIISLDSQDDREYVPFVAELSHKLFGVAPSRLKRSMYRLTTVVISRTSLVTYLKKNGLKVGNKVRQQVGVPSWILKDARFARAVVRGLMDTDGCIFNECHRIKKKLYCYPRISFVNHSKPLRDAVYQTLRKNNFTPAIRNDRAVTLEKREDIVGYFKAIGTHNPKHRRRFNEFTGGVG